MVLGAAFEAYTSEQKRQYIATSISMDTWETESGASILGELQEWGLGIRESDFYAIRREVLDLGYFEQQMIELPQDRLVPRAYMRFRDPLTLSRNVQYRFKADVYDMDTEEEKIITRVLGSDKHLTKQEAEDMIRNQFVRPEAKSNYVVRDVELFEVWINEDAILT